MEFARKIHNRLNATQRGLAYPTATSLILGGAFGATNPFLILISALGLPAASIFIFVTQSNQKAGWKKIATAAAVLPVSFFTSMTALFIGANITGKYMPTETASTPAPPPPPPLSLNQLSNEFKNYPRCDSDVPACKVSQENSFNQSLNSANNLLSSRELAGFTLRVDEIEQSEKGGWDVRGKVTWDLGNENASVVTGVGMAMGIATMLGGGTALDGLGTAANIAKDSYKEIGKCLTSTQLTDTPATQVSVSIKNLSIPDLNGVKDGAFILVKGTSILGFKPGVGIFDDPASTFSTPTQNGFGEMNIAAQGGNASFAGEKVPTKEFCKSKSKTN